MDRHHGSDAIGGAMINLSICYDLLSWRIERILRPLELTMTQLSLLFLFARHPEQSWTVNRLVDATGKHQPGITKAVKAMVAAKRLRRVSDQRDTRVKHLYITEQGLDVLQQAKELTFPMLVESFSVLDDRQLAALSESLESLKARLHEHRQPVRS